LNRKDLDDLKENLVKSLHFAKVIFPLPKRVHSTFGVFEVFVIQFLDTAKQLPGDVTRLRMVTWKCVRP
jgi:hypothetical protein